MSGHGFIRSILDQKSGDVAYEWQGDPRFAAFKEIPSTGWIYALGTSESDLAEASAPIRHGVLAAGAALAVFLSGLLVLGIRKIVTNPLGRITGFAEKVAGGDLKAQLEGDFSFELAGLAQSIRHLVAEIKHKLGFSEGVLKGIGAPLIVADVQGNISYVNSQMLKLLGQDRRQWELFRPERGPPLLRRQHQEDHHQPVHRGTQSLRKS